MNPNDERDIYGRGWAFPPAFNLTEGAEMVQNLDDIRQSLQILFSTLPYERIFRPDYGCDLHSAMFENINTELLAKIRSQINDAMLRYEQRVALDSVQIEQYPGRPNLLLVQVAYRLRGADELQYLEGQLDVAEGGGRFA